MDQRSSTEFSSGRAREDEAVTERTIDGLGVLGLTVLDVLGFVQNHGVELGATVTSGSRRINA
jgi:hypothetical protein